LLIKRHWKVFWLVNIICLFTLTGIAHGQQISLIHGSMGEPFRIRDYAFPSFLMLGFSPTSAAPLGRGHSAIELHYSIVNSFQVSQEVEDYLKQSRGSNRRPLDSSDVDFILGLPQEQAYYIDGEFGIFEFAVHWGLTQRIDLGVAVNYIHYGGNILDETIFNVHDSLSVSQSGRDYVQNDRVQVVLGRDNSNDVVLLDRPTSGGLGDPHFFLRYALPEFVSNWRSNLTVGVKVPLMEEEIFLSTGSWDFGYQLSVDRRFTRDAWALNFGAVFPGVFKQSDFRPPNLPFVNISWLHKFERWDNIHSSVQVFLAEHPYRATVDSALSDMEVQITAGLKWNTYVGVVGFAFTENVFNFDNTPDFGLHLTWEFLK